jgi:hypothetical protein
MLSIEIEFAKEFIDLETKESIAEDKIIGIAVEENKDGKSEFMALTKSSC